MSGNRYRDPRMSQQSVASSAKFWERFIYKKPFLGFIKAFLWWSTHTNESLSIVGCESIVELECTKAQARAQFWAQQLISAFSGKHRDR